jgi:hypothetical protein
MEKKVSYGDFLWAFDDLQAKIYDGRIQVGIIYDVLGGPVHLGVNWAGIGTVSAEETVKFAGKLAAAAEATANFKYNGYTIVYGRD